jgi:hypothetical protein
MEGGRQLQPLREHKRPTKHFDEVTPRANIDWQ